MQQPLGLSAVRTKDLKALLAAVHRGDIHTPLDISELARHGLQHCAESLLGHLRHLDAAAVRAVVVAVLAERQS